MGKSHRPAAFILASLAGLAIAAPATAQLRGNLTVEVEGLRGQKGQVCLKLFSGARGFPNSNESAVRRECVKINGSPVAVTFKNLAYSSYAVAVFHDTNGDRQLSRDSVGMPLEGFGFSRNPIVRTGPPRFGDTLFLLAGANTTIRIQMRYSVGG